MRYWMNFNTKMKFQKWINNHLWHMYRIRSSQGNERGSMNSHRLTPLISLTSTANTVVEQIHTSPLKLKLPFCVQASLELP